MSTAWKISLGDSFNYVAYHYIELVTIYFIKWAFLKSEILGDCYKKTFSALCAESARRCLLHLSAHERVHHHSLYHMPAVLRFLFVIYTLFNSTIDLVCAYLRPCNLQLVCCWLQNSAYIVVAASLITIVSLIQWLYSETSQFTSNEFWCLTVLFKQCKMLTKCNGKLLYLMLMLCFSGAWMCSWIRYDISHTSPFVSVAPSVYM